MLLKCNCSSRSNEYRESQFFVWNLATINTVASWPHFHQFQKEQQLLEPPSIAICLELLDKLTVHFYSSDVDWLLLSNSIFVNNIINFFFNQFHLQSFPLERKSNLLQFQITFCRWGWDLFRWKAMCWERMDRCLQSHGILLVLLSLT